MNIEKYKKDQEFPVIFKPRARLLLQLGDQLIKNESIALIELVKNSYDADANEVKIYMENVEDPGNGVIIIEDDGYGMDIDTVVKVWMEPGSDFKTEKFRKKELSPNFKRLPIGEKGIGRFGVHKLGNKIEMITKTCGSREVFVKIDWNDFQKYRYLDQVPIIIVERNSPHYFIDKNQSGTRIKISALRKEWTKGVARNVKRTITSLISPFSSNDSFHAEFDIANRQEWFTGLLEWKDVVHYSLFHFKVHINGDSISKFNYEFMPWSSMSKLSKRKVQGTDPLIKNFLKIEDDNGNLISLNDHEIGEVIFEGYIFDRDAFLLKLGVSDKLGFKKYLDNNCGVRVFRDGLRVYDYGEPENDWLDLNIRRVNQPTKRISKNIILGAIYINREDSTDLTEKTNREGFVENDAYLCFKSSIIHTLEIIEILRYSDKMKIREFYGPTSKSEPVLQVLGDLKEYIDEFVENNNVKKEIIKYLIKIEGDYLRINENLLKAAGAGLSMSVVIHEVEKIIMEVVKVLKAEHASDRVMKLVRHLSTLIDGYADIIRESTKANENLVDVIKQAIFNTEYRLKTHKIEIEKDYLNYKGSAKIKLARNLLIGSLMNVIDNSIYWLERAARTNKKIYIGISEEETGYLSIVVADNGPGFLLPTDEIIEPFVSAKPGGMGLGLHISNEIMEAQGGKLSFPDWGDFEIPKIYKDGAIVVFSFKKQN